MQSSRVTIFSILLYLAQLKSSNSFVAGGHSFQIPSATFTAINLLDTPSIASNIEDDAPTDEDNRPFVQRVVRSRPARRLNHAFRYLHRHDQNNESAANVTSASEFLTEVVGYSKEQVHDMNATFPPLLELDVARHLYPKLRFMTQTLGVSDMSTIRQSVPPQYFGSRLERIVAPRHAFLVHHHIHPHGRELVLDEDKWRDFLLACRKPKQFCALCNQWNREESKRKEENNAQSELSSSATVNPTVPIVIRQIEAFDVIFQRGLMAATRGELCQSDTLWPLEMINITAAEVVLLLVSHGANPLEKDARGASLLHWAAGTGNLESLKVLLPHFQEKGVWEEIERDGATPLHWAAAGANAREFGIGGNVDVCRYLLEQVSGSDERRALVNQRTKDGNSALMWSSWAASLDIAKLMVRNRADPLESNRNGCTVAHWAASGGNLECCRYLHETVGVDFSIPNHGGNTPLTHAVAFGRANIVTWLRDEVLTDEDNTMAASLAQDFVAWTDGDERRKEILSLFQDFHGGE